jgi:pimeloyl-ACP methyl ester carboxylesterase
MPRVHSDSTTITVLHGWAVDPQNAAKWSPLEKLLEKKGWSLRVLETPGLSTPLHEVWKLDNFVTWLEQQLEGQKDVILLGHSFGGQIASRYTARHPDQIKRLILIDSAGVRDRSLKASVKRTVFWVIAKIGKLFFRGESFRKVLYKAAREQDYFKAAPLLRETMRNVIAEEVVSELPQILCPTLIVWGSQDRATPLKQAYVFHRLIPHNTLQLIDEARHSPQFTHPEQVATSIGHFVEK